MFVYIEALLVLSTRLGFLYRIDVCELLSSADILSSDRSRMGLYSLETQCGTWWVHHACAIYTSCSTSSFSEFFYVQRLFSKLLWFFIGLGPKLGLYLKKRSSMIFLCIHSLNNTYTTVLLFIWNHDWSCTPRECFFLKDSSANKRKHLAKDFDFSPNAEISRIKHGCWTWRNKAKLWVPSGITHSGP